MHFKEEIIQGIIQNRYKRFLSDITLPSGETVVAHVPNTGSMKSCWAKGWKAIVTHKNDPKRKLQYTLEMTHNGESWIGVNTSLPNKLAVEAIKNKTIEELKDYQNITPEKKIGKSRIDLFLTSPNLPDCYVEIKNVTMKGDDALAIFPDAVSERGAKHLHELISLKEQGFRSCMLFIIQREDVDLFRPAYEIDPHYASLLKEAHDKGVEILVYQCKLGPEEIAINKSCPFRLV